MNQPDNNNPTQDSSEYSEEWLSAYIDNELSDSQRAIVEQRLTSDSQTQQLLDDLQRIRGLVHRLPAWSGKLISASEFTYESGASIVAAEDATGNDLNNLGDYHDELQPSQADILPTESQLHSESIAESLEYEGNSGSGNFGASSGADLPTQETSLESLAYSSQRSPASWLRPLVLAACLLILVGGGVWFFNSGSSWTVATSTGGRSETDAATPSAAAVPLQAEVAIEANHRDARIAEAENLPDGLPNLFDASDSQSSAPELESSARHAPSNASNIDSSPPASEDRNTFGTNPMPAPAASFSADGMARKQAPMAASELALEPSADKQKAMQGRRLGGTADDRLDESLAHKAEGAPNDQAKERGADLRGAYGGSAGAGAAMLPQAEAQRFGINSQDRANTKVQLAHSAGWSATDIAAALERLAPLLNLPTAPSADATLANSAAAIPVAIVTSKPPAIGSTPLGEMLQQQAVPLQEVAPVAARPLAWQAPFAQSLADEPSTVALFVVRDEAEQILQAAQQAGELANQPVWISSASGTPTPASPKQQVVLLFVPQ